MLLSYTRRKLKPILLTLTAIFFSTFGCRKQTYCNVEYTSSDDIPYIDLLSGHDWQHFSRAEVKPQGILIRGASALPYNRNGPLLKVKGDFILSATINIQSKKSALIYFCGQLPDTCGDWLQKSKYIAIGVEKEMLRLVIHNGELTIEKPSVDIGDPTTIQFLLKKNGNRIEYYVNNVLAGSFHDIDGIFEQGRIYFGAEAEAGSSFLLSKLQAKPANATARMEVYDNKIQAAPVGNHF
ncbi:MAG TPA: hypothetical protein VM802_19435 [Chitinophaga sp.]|uniref:hypothetical protein n=1 Tax=Chitinophaga sp. TaxID=1869181 RepID=UPI002C397907|nr:hypothetical protein [Chitinophaga sp.]HVI47059.1 hypothetical protein [Chitinophaga sp.]